MYLRNSVHVVLSVKVFFAYMYSVHVIHKGGGEGHYMYIYVMQ